MTQVQTMAAEGSVQVVVPSYNHARYVEQCIRSIFHQSHAPSRLLVIDDGSRDDSPRVIERVLRDAPFAAELLVRPNRGLCATLNQAFEATSGEFFAYVGSDDWWHPDRLRAGVEALRARPACVAAYSDSFVVDGENRVVGDTRQWGRYQDGDILQALLRGDSVPLSTTVLYRRSALEQGRWDEQSRLEDYQTYLRIAAFGEFAYIAEPLAYYRQHGENASGDIDMMLQEMLAAHRRAAPAIGLTERDLERLERVMLFRHGGYYLTVGNRREAVRTTLRGLRGAPSAGTLLRRLAALATPEPILGRRRHALSRRARAGSELRGGG